MTTTERTRHGARIEALLATLDGFVTAQEVFDLLRREGVKIGLATVYRQLQGLAEAGVADIIRTADGQAAYRLCSPDHHHHLICTKCHRTEEFSDADLEPLLHEIAKSRGFSILNHDLELRGLCANCA